MKIALIPALLCTFVFGGSVDFRINVDDAVIIQSKKYRDRYDDRYDRDRYDRRDFVERCDICGSKYHKTYQHKYHKWKYEKEREYDDYHHHKKYPKYNRDY